MPLKIGFVLAVGLLIAADGKDRATKKNTATEKNTEDIQGSWVLVGVEKDGESPPIPNDFKMRITFRGDKFFASGGEKKTEGTFKLDITEKSKTIKMKWKDGKDEKTMFAIYQLAGHVLKICGIEDAKEPPKEFKTAKDSPAVMLTLKREKK